MALSSCVRLDTTARRPRVTIRSPLALPERSVQSATRCAGDLTLSSRPVTARLSEADEDVLFVRPAHSRLRKDLYPDPAAVPATAVRGRRRDARRHTEQRHNDIFEL